MFFLKHNIMYTKTNVREKTQHLVGEISSKWGKIIAKWSKVG